MQARPKSAIFAVPFLSSNMFGHLMSRWKARGFALCRCERPEAASRATLSRMRAWKGCLPCLLCEIRLAASPPARNS